MAHLGRPTSFWLSLTTAREEAAPASEALVDGDEGTEARRR